MTLDYGVESRVKRNAMIDDQQLRIGALSRETGVSIDAIRYYERRGVLPRAGRTDSNYRLFAPESVDRLLMVRRLQGLGWTLDEIVDALQAHDTGDATCESERWRLEKVRERLDQRIAELTITRDELDLLLEACRSGSCEFAATGRSTPFDGV